MSQINRVEKPSSDKVWKKQNSNSSPVIFIAMSSLVFMDDDVIIKNYILRSIIRPILTIKFVFTILSNCGMRLHVHGKILVYDSLVNVAKPSTRLWLNHIRQNDYRKIQLQNVYGPIRNFQRLLSHLSGVNTRGWVLVRTVKLKVMG